MAKEVCNAMKIVIMTVPQREASLRRLLVSVPNAEVSMDKDRNGALWNMEQIMRTHRDGVLILQDDVYAPEWFEEEAAKAVWSGRITTFFKGMNVSELEAAYQKGYSYLMTKDIWGQANYYPDWIVHGYLAWADSQLPATKRGERRVRGRRSFNQDDTSVCQFLRDTGQWAYLTVPNLVQHLLLPSELGHPRSTKGVKWTSPIFGRDLLREWRRDRVGKMKR